MFGGQKKDRKKAEEEASLELNPEDIIMEKQLTGDNKGMYGNVWRGILYKKDVAIKVPKSQNLNEDELEDLKKEIRIWRDNPHGNVVQFMGACTRGGNVRIVVELMDGDIGDLIRQDKNLTDLDLLDFALQAALGMNWLHRKSNIVHRDLKPANVMYKKVGDVYTVKVGDFGLSVVKPRHRKLTDCAGSPLYMPPEVLAGEPYGFEQDVYAFGVSLWQVMSRNVAEPFSHLEHGGDFDTFAQFVLGGKRPPLDNVSNTTGIRELICECWDTDPKARPPFEKLIQKLENVMVNSAIEDPNGRKLWREKFLEKYKACPTSLVPINTMVQELYNFLGYPGRQNLSRVIAYEEAREQRDLDTVNRYQLQIGDSNYDLKLDEEGNEKKESKEGSNGGDGPKSGSGNGSGDGDLPPVEDVHTYRSLVALLSTPESRSHKIRERTVGIMWFGSILKWLGPLTYAPDAPEKDFLKRIVSTLKLSYFHGDIDRMEAKAKMKGTPEGTFLIRFSGQPGLYVFSLIKGNEFKEGRIAYEADRGFSAQHTGGHSYPTLHSFVSKQHAKLGMKVVCGGSKYEELFLALEPVPQVAAGRKEDDKAKKEKKEEKKEEKGEDKDANSEDGKDKKKKKKTGEDGEKKKKKKDGSKTRKPHLPAILRETSKGTSY
eukprot:TRINITY_DN708_c0_g1_i1.p1 TRINITY_DN708_c0_g1~~TRINITY_DN708_c0_g1_i1.p1  ORF type:complete len:657 (+),score=150.04 TRINITY_DN708_c0_g1_i1:195-2165(+)